MTDTISTLRKEWLSEKSDEIEAQISAARIARDAAEDMDNWHLVDSYDMLIDGLLEQKDNLHAQCPFRYEDPRTEAEKAADAFTEEYSNDATISDIRTGFQQW